LISSVVAIVFVVLFLILGLFDLTGYLTSDPEVRPLFNKYLLGQAIGLYPFVLGCELPPFLAVENKGKRTMRASIVFIIVNILFDYLFICVLHMGVFGLALAGSLGMWVFTGIEASYFLSGKSHLKLTWKHLQWSEGAAIVKIGFPGAASSGYQTLRGLIVNWLIAAFVGSVGISAFASSDSVLRIFWAVPAGMLAVSRLMISVSIGEEDRKTLTSIMRVMFTRFIPLMCVICAGIITCAVPLTRIFYHDPAEPVFMMTVWGFRILPLCMPLSIIVMHFTCYGQADGKTAFVHILSLLDGVVCVAGFSALLIRTLGMNSVYVANVLNGIVTVLFVLGYAWFKKRRFPRSMDDLMVIPEDFGVPEEARLDLTIRSIEDVVTISQQVQDFCRSRSIDARRAYLAGLAMEEMAGNIVDHGFVKDTKEHSVDVRVVHKNDDVILRLRDDCVTFDPGTRQKMAEGDDIAKNIGIRMVFKIARSIQYQTILGLNVLTIRI